MHLEPNNDTSLLTALTARHDLRLSSPPSTMEISIGEDIKAQQAQRQLDRWAQGSQAIFAGFVASAHIQGLRPTIVAFGRTPQFEIIRPTLRSLGEAQPAASAGRNGAAEGEGMEEWMETLLAVLQREDNRYTTLSPPLPAGPIPARVVAGRASEEKGELVNQDWVLTSRGKKLFSTREDGRVASPQQGVPKWWNM